MSDRLPVILIAGPTASGKTSLSVRLAKALNGEIINADSMQIYRDLQILSARPDEAEQDGVAHHLFGVMDANTRASVGWWTKAALERIDSVRANGKRAILVGGTGLYFSALVKGLASMPGISAATSAKADEIEAGGMEALRKAAEAYDREAASRILGGDRQRLRRVVEIGLETGRAISEFQQETHPLLPEADWAGLVVEPNRTALYQRIEDRFDTMIEAGGLDEVRALAARDLDPELPAMKALGVPQLLAVLKGEMSEPEAIEKSKTETRRYAKRQMTWFRNQMPDWPRIDPVSKDHSDKEVISLLRRN